MSHEVKEIVSPLKQLLIGIPTDTLLLFLNRIRVHYSISRHPSEKTTRYTAKISGAQMLKYEAISFTSAKAALCNALAQFLIGEQRDIHEYGWVKNGNEIKEQEALVKQDDGCPPEAEG